MVPDQVSFTLDAEKFKQFTATLDAPPGPKPELERLIARKAPWAVMQEALSEFEPGFELEREQPQHHREEWPR